jgi:hypothetical protein
MDYACEGVYSEWNNHVGNESLLVVGVRRHLGKNPSGYSVQFSL